MLAVECKVERSKLEDKPETKKLQRHKPSSKLEKFQISTRCELPSCMLVGSVRQAESNSCAIVRYFGV